MQTKPTMKTPKGRELAKEAGKLPAMLAKLDATLAAIPVLRKPFDPPALVAALRALLPQDANTEASTP